MNEEGAPLPDLSGRWSSGRELRLYQPQDTAAAPPNSSYAVFQPGSGRPEAVCTLSAVYDYESRNRTDTTIHCEAATSAVARGAPRSGSVTGHSTISWSDGTTWRRSPQSDAWTRARYTTGSNITKVHVIFMNHYDVGYTDFLNGVDNKYMHEYFPLAENTSKTMASFKYITHPWLMQRFLECPCGEAPCLAKSLNNSYEAPLSCPTSAEVEAFAAGVRTGNLAWNAAPFNIQPENMAAELFRAGFDLARRMDKRYGKGQTRTMSIRDVMFVTRAALPHMKDLGITGLTIGSNGAGVPPAVPKLHRWIDRETQSDVVVAYHPYGYGGYGLKDCAEAPNGVALCTQFRTDNTGPPSSVKEVNDVLTAVKSEYPGAAVFPSTFDAFFDDVNPIKEQLPSVELEASDTWTYGTSSDPLKMAQHRAIQRTWIRCLQRGEVRCQESNPDIQNMTFFLLKAPEHTWGTPGISGWGGGDNYNVTIFRKNLTNESFLRAAASWAEQRVFNELAVLALEEKGHPLAAEVRWELAAIERVTIPEVRGLTKVGRDTEITLAGGVTIGIGGDGALTTLRSKSGVQWASAGQPMGAFVYQTFNDSQWKPFTYAYMNDHQMQAGFCKPGSNNYSEGRIWKPEVQQLYVEGSSSSASRVVAEMEMTPKTRSVYGAPAKVYLEIRGTSRGIDLNFTLVGKLPVMIGESSSVLFQPAAAPKAVKGGSPWRVDKLGQMVDPEGVQDGGNQYNHGVWDGAVFSSTRGSLVLKTLDSGIVNPMTKSFPIGNPLPASYNEEDAKAGRGLSRLEPGSVVGMAVNVHNNLWNTNYALFYPYYDARYCDSPLSCRYGCECPQQPLEHQLCSVLPVLRR